MKCSRVQFYFVWWLAAVGSGSCWYDRNDEQKLLFVPDADNEPDVEHEISEPDTPDVLKDIDKESKIKEFEIHQSSTGKADAGGAIHTFVVFKTTSQTDGDDWWSLEKNLECIILQRSGNKNDVKRKLDGAERIKVKPIKENLKGKGTIKDLLALLWAHQIVAENLDADDSNCQTFVTLVIKRMTGYENEGYFKCSSPHESERKTISLDSINRLSNVNEWHPLFTFIYLENTELVDALMESEELDIDFFLRAGSLLNNAITLSKTKMVEHFLKPPYSADPTIGDANGMNKLEIAAMYATKTEIFDLLLAHYKVNIDDVDESGQTALHAAVFACNAIAVKYLIKNGANPNIIDNNGMSPLHVATWERVHGNAIIDLLLEVKKVKGLGDVNDQNEQGVTALHYAAFKSNEITAEHLIQKGADVNRLDIEGHTPLHVAASQAKDMKIIDVLLKNIEDEAIFKNDATAIVACAKMNKNERLTDQIVARLVEKGIASIEESQSDEVNAEMFRITIRNRVHITTETYNEIEMNALHLASIYAKTTDLIDEVLRKGEFDINGVDNDGNTPLHYAIEGMNPAIIIPHLILKGADPNVGNKNGVTPLHKAATYAKDVQVVELFLNNPDVDVNLMDDDGRTALEYAMDNKHGLGGKIANLLKGKVDVEIDNKPDAEEALDRAIKNSDLEMIRALIKNGFNFNADEIKLNVLHLASRYAKTTDIIDVILETGEFDINGVDNDGLTPLHHAILGLNPTINVPHLIQLGADPNVADKNGVTPLNKATKNAETMNFIELFMKREAVGIGYCDKQEHNFYPTNVCRVNSY
ncbi:poly [ADP-ribose] polymerase tankyrase-1-like [Daphnia pulicaria]|uniref:poly [ADP-ribose] polymerase tankyrase-1-like n=1 Tax=Daphnia pulicaria TaxID=35523 RepID=UPI001EEAA638|nr:poly [ADP-ribose] polymerase tankyrase-1-like [Daphnia pulicaria]